MTYKLIVFDFDGTLADSFPWFLRTVNTVAHKYRFRPVASHEVDMLRGCSGREVLAHLELPLWKLPMVSAEMRRLMRQNLADIPLFDGVERLLATLAQRDIGTAVVTSNSADNVRGILGERNAAHVRHFECDATIFGKTVKLRKLLKHAGVMPAHVLCIGDEIRDAQAADALGLDFVGVSWGYTRPDVLAAHSSRKLFDSVDDILDLLD